jgi:hypothetical protein
VPPPKDQPQRVERNSPPRPDLVAQQRTRQASSDDLGALAASDAREAALRAAADALKAAEGRAAAAEAELDQERQRHSVVGFPPPIVPAKVPAVVEQQDPAEAELVAGYRRGRKAIGAFGWVLGALTAIGAIGGAGVIGGQVALNPRPAKEANLADTTSRMKLLERWRDSAQPWQRRNYADQELRDLLILEQLCRQPGFRIEGLTCQDVREQLERRRADSDGASWPAARRPPPLPEPETP